MTYIDSVEVSPGNYKPLFENDEVRVLEMLLRPGEKDEVHSHPSETVYLICGGKAKIRLPNGESMEAEVPDGHVMGHEACTHQVENIGSKDIKALIVESKHHH